jgi:hypothetical protein
MENTRNFKGNHYEFQGTPRNSRGIQRKSQRIHEEFISYLQGIHKEF